MTSIESVRHCGDIYARIVSGQVVYGGHLGNGLQVTYASEEPKDISSPWLNITRVGEDHAHDAMYILDHEYLLCTCGSRYFYYDGVITHCLLCIEKFLSLGHPWFERLTQMILVEPIPNGELLDLAVPQQESVSFSWKSEGF